MSLQLAAKHLATKGRGPDTELVHMSKREVRSLQDLARAHGGTLTVNPHTGLPEAGFLNALLPMIAGFALGPAGLAIAESAMGAGLMVGGAATLATGDIKKGLAAGLGAYGGASLGAGMDFSSAGSGASGAGAGAGTTTAAESANFVPATVDSTAGAGDAATKLTGADYEQMTADQQLAANQGARYQFDPNAAGAPKYGSQGLGSNWQAQPVAESSIPGSTSPNYSLSEPKVDYSLKPVDASQTGTPQLANAQPAAAGPRPSNWQLLQKNANMSSIGASLAPMMMYPDQPGGTARAAKAGDSDLGPRYSWTPGYDNTTGMYTGRDTYTRLAVGGSTGNTDADNAAKIQQHQQAMQAAQDVQQVSTSISAAAPTNYTGYDAPPNVQQPVPATSAGISAAAPTNGVSFDPVTQRYIGSGTDANYLGGGQWGLTSAEQTAKDAANAIVTPIDTGSAANGGLMSSYAEGGDVQGDPNMMQVKTYDPVVRMRYGGSPMDYLNYFSAPQTSSARQIAERDYRKMVKDAPTKPKVLDAEPMKKPKGLSDMASLSDSPGLRESAGLYAAGGVSHLGDYSDGGRLLRGPGDGVSDSIPASIGNKRPARLADGEFVVPARIVSELGNGSTEAGARQLYAMMDRVQKARGKTTGKSKVAKNTNAAKYLPA